MSKKIFIVSGGTGGHIIPARCLANLLHQQNHQILFFGDDKIHNYVKSNDTFPTFFINSSQFKKSFFSLIKSLVKISFGVAKSLYFIIKYRPDYVYAFGGYATFPMLIASVMTNRKIILHEQNAHLGKVNRIFAKFAKKIALSFQETSGIKAEYKNKIFFTGNPIRDEIVKLHDKEYCLPSFEEDKITDNKLGYDILLNSDFYPIVEHEKMFKILVIGGSGGAKIFSEILPKSFFNFSENVKENIQVIQQCRSELVESTFEEYKSFNINVIVDSFFENMAQLIDSAHLVIARAGSSSIFEFCMAKKPMIIIPFAKSADNHQQKNADFLAQKGAAIVIEEKDFTIQKINEIFNRLFTEKEILFKMSKNAGNIAITDATLNLSKLINETF
jgi:UDP-N-acetylglucosamine--N-acetylmuramyl-(pentapeptide) pyrophosphoryl-undecaprenol N-acetylglucosamine transferase